MTKGRVALPFRFEDADDEQQVPPLRYAPVGMTLLLETTKERVEAAFHSPVDRGLVIPFKKTFPREVRGTADPSG
jgi:hypothetical protein